MLSINNLLVGESAELVGYNLTERSYRRKLLSMGLTKGVVLTVKKIAPLGDPVEIEVRGYKLVLRKDEAAVLQLRRILK